MEARPAVSESRLVALARQAQNLQPERRTNTLSELRGRWSDYVNPYQTPPQQLSDLANPLRWPAMAVEGIQTAVETVPRMLQPGYDYSDTRQAAEDAFNVAGVVGAGSLLGTAAKPANAVGIFGGRLAKTADQAALAKAEQMASQGVPREQIWNDTGWFQGVDGKWRFEIDDSASELNKHLSSGSVKRWDLTDGVNADDVLAHNDLYAAYPELGRLKTAGRMTDQISDVSDAMSGQRITALGGYTGDSLRLNVRPEEARRVALHELQHGAQDAEQFARGGSPKNFTQQADAELARDAMNWRREINAAGSEEAAIKAMRDMGAEDWIPSAEVRAIASDYDMNPDEQLMEIIKLYGLDNRVTPLSSKDLYQRLAGEVEARTVEKRRDMTAEQRRSRAPWLDYDVPEDQQIVRQR